jgi:2-polyprenyl-3-methyl-5-hydroxy-6-metoxy-1,4-benzoquinol methylase
MLAKGLTKTEAALCSHVCTSRAHYAPGRNNGSQKPEVSMKQWYEVLFANYANQYDNQPFTVGTIGEVDFIEAEINHNRASRILDIGCGTGRHSVELARRGYSVVGVDLSDSMLAKARAKAQASGVSVEFIQADARHLQYRNEFDLVIMLCEGAFPLMQTDEMNFLILQSATNALKDNGKFIFTTLNGLFPLFHSVNDFINKISADAPSSSETFDLMTFRQTSTFNFVDDDGNPKNLQANERYYVPSEISWLLKSLQFHTVDIFGCKLGAFSREQALTAEDFEMLVIAQK